MSASESGFRALHEEPVHQGFIVEFVRAHFAAPDGSTFVRDVIHHPGAVAVAPLHDDGSLTMVRQFRAPLGRELLEIPAGVRDVAHESSAETASRELAEEAGLAADRVEPLVRFHAAPGHTDELVEIFVATGLRDVPTAQHGPEEQAMSIERHHLDDLADMIEAGTLTDAKTVLAVTLLRGRGSGG